MYLHTHLRIATRYFGFALGTIRKTKPARGTYIQGSPYFLSKNSRFEEILLVELPGFINSHYVPINVSFNVIRKIALYFFTTA